MKLAYNQAGKVLGNTGENPAVGCVIVKNNVLISLSHTNINGRPHAERIALSNKKINYKNSVLYSTLESCSHHGKTPPCIKLIEQKTVKNKKITLNLALNYGSKEEIINACKNLALKRNEEININSFKNELYTKNIPDPEILIRTGGAKRLSNFLLWQLAYTEIFFVDKLWPDFKGDDFNKIVNKYYNIKRNFGTI